MSMERQQDYPIYEVNFNDAFLRESSVKQDSPFKNNEPNEELNFSHDRTERKEKKSLRDEEISQLEEKKRILEDFIHRIGDLASSPIRNDILEHCEKVSLHIPHNLNKTVVMKLVKNRVDKMIKNKRIKKNWSEQDINILVWVISKYCQYHGIIGIKDGLTEADWTTIANMIPGVTGKSCMFKWLSLKKSNLAENCWIQEESLLLDQMVKKYGENNWCQISEELYLRNPFPNKVYRCPKQCREHWNCYLNPQLKKGPWQKKQDYLLLRAVKQLQGVKKWAEIVKLFNGRTENALKNRFTLIVDKESRDQKGKRKLTEIELVEQYLKKHQSNSDFLDEQKLKFLMQKRSQIKENQAKKKPSKRTKKLKGTKQEESIESQLQQQQYMPMQSNWRMDKYNHKTVLKSNGNNVDRQMDDRYNRQRESPICYEKQYSVHNIQDFKKQQQIFYSQQQNQHDHIDNHHHAHNPSPTPTPIPQPPNPKIYHPTEPSKQPLNPDLMHQMGQMGVTFILMNDENSMTVGEESVDPNQVCIVPYSDQLFGRFKTNGSSLIPCRISQNGGTYQIQAMNQ